MRSAGYILQIESMMGFPASASGRKTPEEDGLTLSGRTALHEQKHAESPGA
jgi:hypothetical protein